MSIHIEVKERGATPGLAKRAFNNVVKDAWLDAAKEHHKEHTAERFTEQHAREAGYTRRKGEGMPRDSKGFKRSYYGRKLLSADKGGGPGLALPLVYTGRSRQRSRFPRATSTAKGASLKFNVPAFNFRHPKSRVNMATEFRKILPREQRDIANTLDSSIDTRLDQLPATKTTRLR